MPWYKTGTVSVALNSNAVIGTGTAFIANSRVGDGFRGPDGGWYEVTNIASDTAISISPNYQGATNGAGIYALAPLQGYVKDSADTLRALVNTYGAKLAALGTTGNYDVLPVGKGGTGITNLSAMMQDMLGKVAAVDARFVITAAKSGANNDITSLNALTTAISVAQGGTGGTTQALARSGLGLGTAAVAAIIGAVSQSGGTPTGALMEYVSGANGEAWKFASGLMICTRSRSYGLVVGDFTIYGSIWYYYGSWTFPSSFAAPPVVTGAARGAGRVHALNADPNTTVSTCNFFVIDYTSPVATTVSEKLVAVGRWF
ncbi:phage tail protein [Pseudomonas sp. F01002]|nr:phage tail protein [Pseudomonas sp. F01002]TFB40926.1 phage tail protein [Pseudomonas sp. F01002]